MHIPITNGLAMADDGQYARAIVSDRKDESVDGLQTVVRTDVNVVVMDPDGPVQGAIVGFSDPANGGTALFQSITDEEGRVVGQLTTLATSNEVWLTVHAGKTVASQAIRTESLNSIERQIAFSERTGAVQHADTDGDGVPDSLDAYPHDATRSFRLVFPEKNPSVIAFEDRPEAGDADYNDLVMYAKNEEDRDAAGRVVRFRGMYRVLARGAQYRHNPFLNLPGSGVVHIVVRNGENQVVVDIKRSLEDLTALPLFPRNREYFDRPSQNSDHLFDSSVLCPGSCNVRSDTEFVSGYSSEIEVVFDEPRLATGAPFDLFLYVVDTQKTIHLSAHAFSARGEATLPGALLIPAEWNWPLEGHHIRRGYPEFQEWLLSDGARQRDWYLQTSPDSHTYLYHYFMRSPVAAYVLRLGISHQSLLWAFVAVMLTGLIVLLFLRGRSEFEA